MNSLDKSTTPGIPPRPRFTASPAFVPLPPILCFPLPPLRRSRPTSSSAAVNLARGVESGGWSWKSLVRDCVTGASRRMTAPPAGTSSLGICAQTSTFIRQEGIGPIYLPKGGSDKVGRLHQSRLPKAHASYPSPSLLTGCSTSFLSTAAFAPIEQRAQRGGRFAWGRIREPKFCPTKGLLFLTLG